MLLDVRPDHLQIVQAILQKHVPDREVWAFGSRAKWIAKEYSDLDLCIVSEKPISFTALGLLAEAFDESDLPYKVDVVDWATTSESFKKIIQQDKVVIQKNLGDLAMSFEWPVLPLEDCLDALIDYRGKTPEKTKAGIPLITAKVIKDGRIDTPTEFIAIDNYDTWRRPGIPECGDAVLSVEAPLGEVAQLGPDKIALAQRVVTLRGKSRFLDSTYLLYWLQSHNSQEQLKARATGTTVVGIEQSELRKLSIPVPPLEVQLAIAKTLRTLDDRITLLRETNQTLEAIAQALFKSWFVDFDPVRAKAEGRLPDGIDEATAATFPGAFEETELGLVPKGWVVGSLGRLAELNPESWSAKYHPDRIHYIDLANTKAGNIDDITVFSFDEAPSRARRVLRIGDVIIGTVRPGNRSFARIASYLPGLTGSTGFAVLRPIEKFDQAIVYIAATSDVAIDRLSHLADGGAYPAVRPEVISSTPLIVAPEVIRKAFGEVANTLYIKVAVNQEHMQSLASIRDTLLPRLISGQLRIKDAEKWMERVATVKQNRCQVP